MDKSRIKSLKIELELYHHARARIKELLTFFEKNIERTLANIKTKPFDACADDFAQLFEIAVILNNGEHCFGYKMPSYLYNFAYLFKDCDEANTKHLFTIIQNGDIFEIL